MKKVGILLRAASSNGGKGIVKSGRGRQKAKEEFKAL